MVVLSYQQPPLDAAEQESVYQILDSINPAIPWRSLFPDDLCVSGPHGVVCDYPSESNASDAIETARIVELNFGYVSDYTPNPPCSPNATLNPLIFTSFKYLRKLFFYKCFNESRVSFPEVFSSFGSSLEEIVFIENPSLVGSLSGVLRNFTNLRRLVLNGNGIDGEVPEMIGDLVNLEEITLSRNQLTGELPGSFANLKKLKLVDLSENNFEGCVPESLGSLTELLKLDMRSNRFMGKIPESLRNLQGLEFLDLSYNHFGNFGVPLFLGEIPRLREVYLSGNSLGGKIPEIWENLGGVRRIGFSELGLIGNIPASMGFHLRNLSYLGLDNNKLEGSVPEEFCLLELIDEINLENNNLSGRIPPLNLKVGEKLKLAGNRGLCVDNMLRHTKIRGSLAQLKLCHSNKPEIPNAVFFNEVSLAFFNPHLVDPDGDPGSKSEFWLFNLDFDELPPLEASFDFFLRDFFGMSGRFLAGDSLPSAESKGVKCRAGLDPSDESLSLDDLLCFGFSDFSLVGEPVTSPDDRRLFDFGKSGRSLSGEFIDLELLPLESTYKDGIKYGSFTSFHFDQFLHEIKKEILHDTF
ncbi:piriformospora indica-insensitive protein 2-like [Senna tora]|uniref:Piriformospora indica-insensitive protein 2-like n=1 Tax=Senna tora TaxID=362788 RepID=A0A834WIM3_9FABA|nr:piriformospora indica-insensitive protein 2-like [Senna tora]